ncbi:C40 family peptidase [Clostridium estertheticum]|uniref:C40 family peptidase n=1 Tax=Clostridium estertheticum TaxID=238834 RepID=UPI001C0AD1D2|nr:C40 family peptidase [Clostridium estertheticum]MBU3202056.1 C40 family peptidase [Clostridium estertheticum]WAG67722.1 C40 family peptidase [Clostridium estertheticum]
MRKPYYNQNSINPWFLTLILIFIFLIYMIFTIFSNSKTPLNKAKYITNGQQYSSLINGNDLKAYSDTFLGMHYLWGGTTPAISDAFGKYMSGGFDCSGFVAYTYKHFGIDLPRTTMEQVNEGISINMNDLRNGDLVFFETNPDLPYQVSHVGIYIGSNKFIHSPKSGDVIKISELTGYYKEKFVIGKRILK